MKGWLFKYQNNNQREYYDALTSVQLQGKWANWIKFSARGVESAVQESIGTVLGLEAILKRWKAVIEDSGTRKQSILYKLPELLLGTPVLTAHKAKDALGISFPSASAALKLMEEYEILTQQNRRRRNRVFYAKEVIELLDKPSAIRMRLIGSYFSPKMSDTHAGFAKYQI